MRAMVTRIAGDSITKPANRRAKGLDLKALANIEFEFFRWAYVQTNLDSRYKAQIEPAVDPVPRLQPPMGLSPDVRAKIDALDGSDWDEFEKIKTLIRPLFPDETARVMLVPESELNRFGLKHGFYNLSMMNILRSSVALVFRGYSESGSSRWLWDSGIKGPEMQKFYVDFRDFGIDIGFVDKRNTNSGSRAFIEGKLFTSSSTGFSFSPTSPDGGELSFIETMEYFAFLFSGGQQAKDIFAQLMIDCPQGPLDINGLPKVSRACAIARMPAMVDQFMGNMPYLQGYVAMSSSAARSAYSRIIVETAYSPTASEPDWVEKNEISTLAVVVHYAESVMTRFDRNQDGKLDNSELEGAVPIFAGFIKKIRKDTTGKDLSDAGARAAFFYILTYKTLPESIIESGIVLKNEFLWEPTLSLDRTQLAEVFKSIIARLFEVGKKQAVPVYTEFRPCHGFDGPPSAGCYGMIGNASSITTH
ncbi:MAG: hypothetical protein ACXVA9_13870, partial [Bdellovibrionales bacterium]